MKNKLLLTALALCTGLTLCVAQQKAWQTIHYPSAAELERTFAVPQPCRPPSGTTAPGCASN